MTPYDNTIPQAPTLQATTLFGKLLLVFSQFFLQATMHILLAQRPMLSYGAVWLVTFLPVFVLCLTVPHLSAVGMRVLLFSFSRKSGRFIINDPQCT